MTSKQERIRAIRDEINRVVNYGDMLGIQVIVNGFTEMLLVLAEDDYDEIAKRMLNRFMSSPVLSASDWECVKKAETDE